MEDYYSKMQEVIKYAVSKGWEPHSLIDWNVGDYQGTYLYENRELDYAKDILKTVIKTSEYAELIPHFNVFHIGTIIFNPDFLKKFFGEQEVETGEYISPNCLKGKKYYRPHWQLMAYDMIGMKMGEWIEYLYEFIEKDL